MKITLTKQSRRNEVDFNNLAFGKVFSDHMFMCKFKEGQWQESEILPYQPISMAPGTHVFHYGQAVFEGMKAFKSDEVKRFCFDQKKILIDSISPLNDYVCPPFLRKIFFQA